MTRSSIAAQGVARAAVTTEGTRCVGTVVLTTAVVKGTLVDIYYTSSQYIRQCETLAHYRAYLFHSSLLLIQLDSCIH